MPTPADQAAPKLGSNAPFSDASWSASQLSPIDFSQRPLTIRKILSLGVIIGAGLGCLMFALPSIATGVSPEGVAFATGIGIALPTLLLLLLGTAASKYGIPAPILLALPFGRAGGTLVSVGRSGFGFVCTGLINYACAQVLTRALAVLFPSTVSWAIHLPEPLKTLSLPTLAFFILVTAALVRLGGDTPEQALMAGARLAPIALIGMVGLVVWMLFTAPHGAFAQGVAEPPALPLLDQIPALFSLGSLVAVAMVPFTAAAADMVRFAKPGITAPSVLAASTNGMLAVFFAACGLATVVHAAIRGQGVSDPLLWLTASFQPAVFVALMLCLVATVMGCNLIVNLVPYHLALCAVAPRHIFYRTLRWPGAALSLAVGPALWGLLPSPFFFTALWGACVVLLAALVIATVDFYLRHRAAIVVDDLYLPRKQAPGPRGLPAVMGVTIAACVYIASVWWYAPATAGQRTMVLFGAWIWVPLTAVTGYGALLAVELFAFALARRRAVSQRLHRKNHPAAKSPAGDRPTTNTNLVTGRKSLQAGNPEELASDQKSQGKRALENPSDNVKSWLK